MGTIEQEIRDFGRECGTSNAMVYLYGSASQRARVMRIYSAFVPDPQPLARGFVEGWDFVLERNPAAVVA